MLDQAGFAESTEHRRALGSVGGTSVEKKLPGTVFGPVVATATAGTATIKAVNLWMAMRSAVVTVYTTETMFTLAAITL